MNRREQHKRQLWFASYQNAIEKRDDYTGGAQCQVCWDTALHLYNKGLSPEVAATHSTAPYK